MMIVELKDIQSDGNVRHEVGDVTSLAANIDRHGLLSPLNVAPHPDGNYTLIAGHRRFAALESLGITDVEVIVNGAIESDQDRIAAQYSENVMRKDLSAYEKAQVTLELKEYGLNQKAVAADLELKLDDVSKMQKAARFVADLPNAHEADKLSAEALFELVEIGSQEDVVDATLVAENALRAIVNGDARTVSQAFGTAEREANKAAAVEKLTPLLDELAALKITVVKERPQRAETIGQHQANGLCVEGDLPSSEEWVLQHRQLDCHAIWMTNTYNGPMLMELCVKPGGHKAKGKSGLKEASADEKQSRADKDRATRKEIKEAKTGRLDNVEAFANSGWNQADLLKLLPKAIRMSNDVNRTMCRALNVERINSQYGDYPDYSAMIAGWLEGQSDKKKNLFPVVAAMAYTYVEQHNYSGDRFEEVFEG